MLELRELNPSEDAQIVDENNSEVMSTAASVAVVKQLLKRRLATKHPALLGA